MNFHSLIFIRHYVLDRAIVDLEPILGRLGARQDYILYGRQSIIFPVSYNKQDIN